MTRRTIAVERGFMQPTKDVEDIASRIRELNSEYDVLYTYYPEAGGGGGTQLFQTIAIWLVDAWEVIDEPLVGAIVTAAVEWARQRITKAKEAGETEKVIPHFVSLYGPNGKVLRRIKVESKDGTTYDVTKEARNQPPREMPPLFTSPQPDEDYYDALRNRDH